MAKSRSVTFKIGCFPMLPLTLLLIVLKALGLIALSWWWIWFTLWFPILVVVLIWVIIAAVAFWASR